MQQQWQSCKGKQHQVHCHCKWHRMSYQGQKHPIWFGSRGGIRRFYEAGTDQIRLEWWSVFQHAFVECQLYVRHHANIWHKGEKEGWGWWQRKRGWIPGRGFHMDIITEIMECFQKTTKEQSGLDNTQHITQ